MDWSLDDLSILRRDYASCSDDLLAERLGRSIHVIRSKAAELALAKNKAAFSGTRKMPRWDTDEIRRLRAMYQSKTNVEIALALGRSIKSVTSKASGLGLMKTKKQLQAMGTANRALRRKNKTAKK